MEKHSRQSRLAEAIGVALGRHKEVEVRRRLLEFRRDVVEFAILDLQRRVRGGLERRVYDVGQGLEIRSPWVVRGEVVVS